MSPPLSLKEFRRPVLSTSTGDKRVLLHSCCAPCSGEVIEAMHASGFDLTIYFYNPNIHPREEYELRKSENIRFASQRSIPFIDADYDPGNWFARAKGLEWEPERGARCTMCFDMRFERTALYAHEKGFPVITSCLGISRWKNFEQINLCGVRAASHYPGITYWTLNWRKKGGSQRMVEISKREHFYMQEYCGCIYSLRDTNKWRVANGRPKIRTSGRNSTSRIADREEGLLLTARRGSRTARPERVGGTWKKPRGAWTSSRKLRLNQLPRGDCPVYPSCGGSEKRLDSVRERSKRGEIHLLLAVAQGLRGIGMHFDKQVRRRPWRPRRSRERSRDQPGRNPGSDLR